MKEINLQQLQLHMKIQMIIFQQISILLIKMITQIPLFLTQN